MKDSELIELAMNNAATTGRHVSIIRTLVWGAEASVVRKDWCDVRDDILERLSELDRMTHEVFDRCTDALEDMKD